MDMAMRNAVHLHLINQMANVGDFNERVFHARDDAFDLSDRQFVKIYRLNKEEASRVIEIFEENSREPTRSSALDASVQVLTALRFFGAGSYQKCIGSNVHMAISQSSVSRCIHNVINVLNLPQILNNWVHFPSSVEELIQLRNRFWQRHRFPGTIGCIDCTHVAIFPPPKEDDIYPEHVYVNRKQYHSINVQLMCDPDLKIMSVNARYPGSSHDSYIWNNSNVYPVMREIYNRGHTFFLLGDSGYAQRPWMMTPVLQNEEDPAVRRYNECQKRTRSLIERCNGVLKMRFRCLLKHRVLHYRPDICSKIINACTVLHNMCINNNVPMPEDDDPFEEQDFGMYNNNVNNEMEIAGMVNRNADLTAGRRVRTNIIQRYFS